MRKLYIYIYLSVETLLSDIYSSKTKKIVIYLLKFDFLISFPINIPNRLLLLIKLNISYIKYEFTITPLQQNMKKLQSSIPFYLFIFLT